MSKKAKKLPSITTVVGNKGVTTIEEVAGNPDDAHTKRDELQRIAGRREGFQLVQAVMQSVSWIDLFQIREERLYKETGCESMDEYLEEIGVSPSTARGYFAEISTLGAEFFSLCLQNNVARRVRRAFYHIPEDQRKRLLAEADGKDEGEVQLILFNMANSVEEENVELRKRLEKTEKKAQRDMAQAATQIGHLNQAVADKAAEGKGGSPYDPAKQRSLDTELAMFLLQAEHAVEEGHKAFDSCRESVCFAPDFPATAHVRKMIGRMRDVAQVWEKKLDLDEKRVGEMGLKDWMKAGHLVKPKAIPIDEIETEEDLLAAAGVR